MTRLIASLVLTLVLGSAPAIAAQQETVPKKPQVIQKTPQESVPIRSLPDAALKGFGVVLLLGDMQPGGDADSVPFAAKKALSDMRDFLPYKSYQVLDVQWTRCCGSPTTSRLRGADDQEYELQVRSSNSSDGRLFVQFLLREPGALVAELAGLTDARAAEVHRELFTLEREMSDLKLQKEKMAQLIPVGGASESDMNRISAQLALVTKRISELRKSIDSPSARRAARIVIDTSFTMDVGETVVVGTSRLKGGSKALIAILTAAPRGAPNDR
jgi:hypothetical protein